MLWRWFFVLTLVGAGACGRTESTGEALSAYERNPVEDQGREFLIRGVTEDRWESPRYLLLKKNRAASNREILKYCEDESRLRIVPLDLGQSILRIEFKVHEEGRTCYDRDLGRTCQAWNYHGVYSCFYFLSKAP